MFFQMTLMITLTLIIHNINNIFTTLMALLMTCTQIDSMLVFY